MQSKRYNFFINALVICLGMFIIAFSFILIHGKVESFLLINQMHSTFFDIFFTWFTYFGDAWIWLPLTIYFAIWQRKYLLLILFALLLCNFFSQFSKHIIFPEDLRPFVLLSGDYNVHTIPGVEISRKNSFPSGHTTTAYTLSLIFSYLAMRKWLSILFPMIAFGVAWSRVYQGQHFVTDVAAGMFLGMLAAFLAIGLFEKIEKDKQLKPINKKQSNGD